MDFVDKRALADMLKAGVTVQEALDIAFGDFTLEDPIEEIFISPPEATILSDEDSGDEDEGGSFDNLSKRQLLAEAEVRTASGTVLDEEIAYPNLKSADRTKWIEGDIQQNEKKFPQPDYSHLQNLSIVDFFEVFIDEDIILYLIQEASRYALFINQPDPSITKEEMKCFLAILILSGYNTVPSKRMYWEKSSDTRNELVYNAMRRNRFEQILRFVHLANNEDFDSTSRDKLWKLRPFINKIRTNFRSCFVPEKELAFDESMVRYYGKHGCKQFIRAKPIRFGYKVWCLNTSTGYLIDFEVYQGKSVMQDSEAENAFGKAAAPLVKMIKQFPDNIRTLPFNFYFDNLFTSLNLLQFLRLSGYGATGTMRENRLPKNCPLSSKSALVKKQRGYYESTISHDDGVLVSKWVDNSVVCVASTIHGTNPVTNVKRYLQKDKRHIMVTRPALLGEYNKNMGGTDRMDQNINQYRIKIRNRKWYWALFSWFIDASINNAWFLCRKATNSSIPQIAFRRTVVQAYLKKYTTAPKRPGRTPPASVSQKVADEVRYDGMSHLIEKIPQEKRRRCAGNSCKCSARTQCRKCNVGLCIDCFVSYHTR